MEKHNDIGSALESLTEAFKRKERELAKRETELSAKRKKLDVDIKTVYGHAEPSDVIHLNIGGQRIDVLRRTLCYVENSMLASMFSGRWDDSLEKDRDGNFFMDQDFNTFKLLIDYLRDKSIETPKYPVCPPKGDKKFYRFLDYYGLTDGVYQTWFEPRYVPDDTSDAFVITNGTDIDAKEWCTFELKAQHHCREIKSFEVELGEVQRLQIGLGLIPKLDKNGRSINSTTYVFDYSQSTGVGDAKYTYSLDSAGSCILYEGNKSYIQSLEIKEGVRIKIELQGNWFVDGKLVASFDGNNGSKMIESLPKCGTEIAIPAISIKGRAKIVNIEYGNWIY